MFHSAGSVACTLLSVKSGTGVEDILVTGVATRTAAYSVIEIYLISYRSNPANVLSFQKNMNFFFHGCNTACHSKSLNSRAKNILMISIP